MKDEIENKEDAPTHCPLSLHIQGSNSCEIIMTGEGGVEELPPTNTAPVCTAPTQHLPHLTQLPPTAAITVGGTKRVVSQLRSREGKLVRLN